MKLATSNRRLLKLAAFLDNLPRARFNYSVLAGHDWNGRPDLSCGTQACALGWATTIPAFRRLGLRMSLWHDGGSGAYVHLQYSGDSVSLLAEAVQHVFGPMGYDDMDLLFNARHTEPEKTPKQVAAKIRKFVAGRG